MFPILFLLASTSAAVINTKEKIITLNLELSRETKRTLGFPEDSYLNFTELATKYGYPVEEHTAITEDGYYNKLFRLGNNLGPAVMLMHGLIDSPDAWIISGPNRSIAYQLVDSEYDVWCVDFRGSKYTRKHLYLNPDVDIKFWKFGPDEISQYDLPTMIEYILNYRNVPTLSYVGHSMGCRLFYQIGAYNPRIFKKVDVMVSLAPAAWTTYLYNPTLRFFSTVTNEIEAIANHVGIQEVFGSRSVIGNTLFQLMCARTDARERSLNEKLCSLIIDNTYGPGSDQLDPDMIPIIYGQGYCTTSSQTIFHMSQGLHSTKFQRYDRGRRGNLKAYGTSYPPEYNPKLVTTPVAVISGGNDWLSSIEDVTPLKDSLPNFIEHYVISNRKWNHIDFVWGRDAKFYVGNKILSYLSAYAKTES